MPLPNDHVKAIVELLRGDAPDLLRRWLAALLIVPPAERERVVNAVERSIVREYDRPPVPAPGTDTDTRRVRVIGAKTQRDGFVEQVTREYADVSRREPKPTSPRKPNRQAGA